MLFFVQKLFTKSYRFCFELTILDTHDALRACILVSMSTIPIHPLSMGTCKLRNGKKRKETKRNGKKKKRKENKKKSNEKKRKKNETQKNENKIVRKETKQKKKKRKEKNVKKRNEMKSTEARR